MRSVFVTHPKGGEGKQTCTVTCMDREWFPEKPELGAENQKSNYLLWHSWTFLRKKSNTELLYFIKTLLLSVLDTFNFANQCLFAKANQDKKSSVETSVPGCKWQLFCLDGKRKIWLFFSFAFYSQITKVNFIMVLGRNFVWKVFIWKQCKPVLVPFRMKMFYSLHCRSCVDVGREASLIPFVETSALKSSHLILYGSTVQSVGCTKINVRDFWEHLGWWGVERMHLLR